MKRCINYFTGDLSSIYAAVVRQITIIISVDTKHLKTELVRSEVAPF